MAFLHLTACSSFSHDAYPLLVPLRPDWAQCLTGLWPTSRPGSQCPWPGWAGLWELRSHFSPSVSLFPRCCLHAVRMSLSCFGLFFFSSAATRLSSHSLSLHTPQAAATPRARGPQSGLLRCSLLCFCKKTDQNCVGKKICVYDTEERGCTY